jgi:uncharacterized membrane protein
VPTHILQKLKFTIVKKLIFLLMSVLGLLSVAQAQTPISSKATGDTATDATTKYVSTGVAFKDMVGIQVIVTKVSGTVAGTVLLQGTIDGTNYVDVNTDTLTLTNQATNTKVWALSSVPYRIYRVKLTTTGTQVSIPSIAWLRRP